MGLQVHLVDGTYELCHGPVRRPWWVDFQPIPGLF
jgi:hypothetical protein